MPPLPPVQVRRDVHCGNTFERLWGLTFQRVPFPRPFPVWYRVLPGAFNAPLCDFPFSFGISQEERFLLVFRAGDLRLSSCGFHRIGRALGSVDLIGSHPLFTVIEAKNVWVLASLAVMKGSDPIKSTLCLPARSRSTSSSVSADHATCYKTLVEVVPVIVPR